MKAEIVSTLVGMYKNNMLSEVINQNNYPHCEISLIQSGNDSDMQNFLMYSHRL